MPDIKMIAIIKKHLTAYDTPYWRALPHARESAKQALRELLKEFEL